MINLRRFFACLLHCNYIEFELQVDGMFLTEIIFTQHSQFLNIFEVTDKDGRSPILFLRVSKSQNTRYSPCSATMSIPPIMER